MDNTAADTAVLGRCHVFRDYSVAGRMLQGGAEGTYQHHGVSSVVETEAVDVGGVLLRLFTQQGYG